MLNARTNGSARTIADAFAQARARVRVLNASLNPDWTHCACADVHTHIIFNLFISCVREQAGQADFMEYLARKCHYIEGN